MPLMAPPYESRTQIGSLDRCVNLYGERAEGKLAFLPRPGLQKIVGTGYVSTLFGHIFPLDDQRVLAIQADATKTFIIQSGLATPLWGDQGAAGNVGGGDDGFDFASTVLGGIRTGFLCGGTYLNVYTDGGGIQPVTYSGHGFYDADAFPASSACFTDGYFLFTKESGASGPPNEWFWTDLNSISFSALSRALAYSCPEGLIAVRTLNRRIYLFGQKTIEIWWNSGNNPDLPFEREQGGVIPIGTVGMRSIVATDSALYFLGKSAYGQLSLYRMVDQSPQVVSNPAIDTRINGWGVAASTRVTVERWEGHQFIHVVPYNPSFAGLVYDEAENVWHERTVFYAGAEQGAGFSQCAWVPRGDYNGGAGVRGCHLWVSGLGAGVYRTFSTQLTDDGAAIYKRRTAPSDSPSGQMLRWAWLEAFVDTGGVSSPGTTLRWSDDGGTTWNAKVVTEKSGISGERWMRWLQLGASRGRIYEILDTSASTFRLYDVHEKVEGLAA